MQTFKKHQFLNPESLSICCHRMGRHTQNIRWQPLSWEGRTIRPVIPTYTETDREQIPHILLETSHLLLFPI